MRRFGVDTLGEDERRNLNLSWHRLDSWRDVSPGLSRLERKYLLAPVSNGNISMMVDLARRNGFPWDAILGAEIAGDYKPKPRVYLAAAEALDLAPPECMMVAAAASCSVRFPAAECSRLVIASAKGSDLNHEEVCPRRPDKAKV